jgi:hypothetical protein
VSLNSTAGDPNADSYIALADANTYFANRGELTWTGTDAAKEQALRRGTTYLDNQYRSRWVGLTVTQTQSLGWPRCDGMRGYYRGYTQLLLDINGFQIPQTVVPLQVQQAAAEAALLYLQGVPLEPRLIRGNQIKSIMNKVDVIQTETVWGDNATPVDRYLVIEGLLRGLVLSSPGSPTGTVQLLRG